MVTMKEPMLVCPRCKIRMKKLKRQGVTIDVCKKCNGMWLDDGEIVKLAAMVRGETHEKA
ncbi:MAG: zf-TFIIB domain-containing protein [Nanoarchaeota archaeon]